MYLLLRYLIFHVLNYLSKCDSAISLRNTLEPSFSSLTVNCSAIK